ncbi:hypothetical protein ACB092_11G039500 [Castanea dentata]
MQFDSLDDVETFYKEFAKKEGFGIRIRTSKKAARSDNVTNRVYKWVVKGFDNNHNHGIISPKSVSYLRCHTKMSTAAKSLVENFGEEGLPTGKVAMMFNVGDRTFTSKDCWNHLRDVRGKNLDAGDASAVLDYCQKQQAQNSNFFYAIQLTFGTTYKTNKYDMPFAPFTRLNHHCQSILFGCALLQDETEQTFVWLFEIWLQAMWGKEPKSIITDQDLAMGAAIAKVLPRTRHRLCLWHIKKKFPEKLSHIYHKKSIFKRDLKRCIRINTTRRSESINAFFDSFVNSRTTLTDFVVKFAKAMDSRYKKERKEDFDSRHKTPSLVIGSKIEHQAASIYTRTIFSKFQKELVSSNHFTKEKVEKNGTFYRYKVTSSFDPDDAFIVKLNLESKVCECDCQLFEFMGIVCRHMLLIFQVKNIFQIPSHYILQRWTKEANKELKNVEYRSSFEDEHHMSRALRSIHVCQCVSQLSYLAEKSEDIYKMIISELDHTLKKAFGMENELLEDKEDDEMDMHHKSGESADIVEVEDCSVIVPLNRKDPHVSQTKGRKKSTEKQGPAGRIKGGLEIFLARAMPKRRSCQLCGGYGHNRRTFKQYNGEGSD